LAASLGLVVFSAAASHCGLEDAPDPAVTASARNGSALLQRDRVIAMMPPPPPQTLDAVGVPVPLYYRKQPPCIGGNGSNPLIGDPFERRCKPGEKELAVPPDEPYAAEHAGTEARGGEHAEGEEESHSRGPAVMLLLCIVLLAGIVTSHVLERYIPFVPYTAALFLSGMFVSLSQNVKRHYGGVVWPTFDAAVSSWEKADPHLILFIFLPPLIFGEAMSLNVSQVKRCFSQCVMLAGPGVIIGAALTALVGRYVFPYGWDWSAAMLFGSILSATDPVAVVAIFNSLGVSPRLTMLISGESLFNDGTAFVVFILMMDVCQGVQPTAGQVVTFFLRMTTLGPFIGASLGFLTIWFIGLSSEERYHGDTMGQVVVTLCCAYLSHNFAEQMGSSGVLALVTSGIVVASYAWPLFISRETMHIVWHAIEFVGNTVIFSLAGLIFGGICCERREIIEAWDFFYLIVLYVLSTLIRASMVGILWLPLNCVGQSISPQEALVMVWSGMRGAVGLLMAVLADRNPYISTEAGTRIMFHMGGMAALMLLVNGPLTPLVLDWCGLMDSTVKEAVVEDIRQRVAVRTRAKLREELRSDTSKNLFAKADTTQVIRLVPALAESDVLPPVISQTQSDVGTASHSHLRRSGTDLDITAKVNQIRLWKLRESFLRVVKASYWELCDLGVLPRKTKVAKVLLDSADLGMMGTSGGSGLSDWEVVKVRLQLGLLSSEEEYGSKIRHYLHHDFEHYRQLGIFAALAFIHAHKHALEEMNSFRRQDDVLEAVLTKEVEEQNSAAAAFVEGMSPDMVTLVQSEMLARKLLQFQTNTIGELAERGLITDTHAAELEHQLHTSKRNLKTMGNWQDANLMTSLLGVITAPEGVAAGAGGAAADIAAGTVNTRKRSKSI